MKKQTLSVHLGSPKNVHFSRNKHTFCTFWQKKTDPAVSGEWVEEIFWFYLLNDITILRNLQCTKHINLKNQKKPFFLRVQTLFPFFFCLLFSYFGKIFGGRLTPASQKSSSSASFFPTCPDTTAGGPPAQPLWMDIKKPYIRVYTVMI